MARPSKLDDLTAARICKALRRGHYLDVAAADAGLHAATVARWRVRGREALDDAEGDVEGVPDNERAYAAFALDVNGALAEAKGRLLKVIEDATPTTWQCAAWLLERRFPSRWARRPQDTADSYERGNALQLVVGVTGDVDAESMRENLARKVEAAFAEQTDSRRG